MLIGLIVANIFLCMHTSKHAKYMQFLLLKRSIINSSEDGWPLQVWFRLGSDFLTAKERMQCTHIRISGKEDSYRWGHHVCACVHVCVCMLRERKRILHVCMCSCADNSLENHFDARRAPCRNGSFSAMLSSSHILLQLISAFLEQKCS